MCSCLMWDGNDIMETFGHQRGHGRETVAHRGAQFHGRPEAVTLDLLKRGDKEGDQTGDSVRRSSCLCTCHIQSLPVR
jgi:hypothetical protein